MANLGWDEVRLPHPVFEGDTIYSQSEVLSTRESKSRPNVGIVSVEDDRVQPGRHGRDRRSSGRSWCTVAGHVPETDAGHTTDPEDRRLRSHAGARDVHGSKSTRFRAMPPAVRWLGSAGAGRGRWSSHSRLWAGADDPGGGGYVALRQRLRHPHGHAGGAGPTVLEDQTVIIEDGRIVAIGSVG